MGGPQRDQVAGHGSPSTLRAYRGHAFPAGVLITLPLLVFGVGVGILWFARKNARESAEGLVEHHLATSATHAERQIAYALDQATAILDRAQVLADDAMPMAVAGPVLHDLTLGRAGITHISVSFPSGVLRSSYYEGGNLRVQETRVELQGSSRSNYVVEQGNLREVERIANAYDPRERPFYVHAADRMGRSWTAPRTYFSTKTTGISATDSVRGARGELRAVVTVDFDMTSLSPFVADVPLLGARTMVFSADHAVLVHVGEPPAPTMKQETVLRIADLNDPALVALAAMRSDNGLAFHRLRAGGEAFVGAVAPVGGARAGISEPLRWYVATVVPESSMLMGAHQLERRTLVIGLLVLGVTFLVSFVLLWHLVRMRRTVAVARAQAQSAEDKARELGSYRLLELLGKGGMGEVWSAEHRLLARQAAVKLLRAEGSDDARTELRIQERFRREAQALAAMRSRHTIELFDYGVTEDNTFFYVMELLDGVNLEVLVRRHGPLPAGRVILFMLQACASLAEAHDAGLLHRDIKPANLFACRAADEVDIIKVLDFGVVRTATARRSEALLGAPPARDPRGDRLTQIGAVLGTPGFMAPEQALGRELDARSDLYSLGCVAWWLLTGQDVFPNESDVAMYYAHVHDDVPSLRDKVAGWLPYELEAIVLACLQKDPARRPDNARSLAERLRQIPIPLPEVWSLELAQAWWLTYYPAGPTVDASASVPRLLRPKQQEPDENYVVSFRDQATVNERRPRA